MIHNIPDDRYLRLTGTPYQIGLTLGEKLGGQLEADIDRYLHQGPGRFCDLDWAALSAGAMDWHRSLPQRYQTELEGMADGSGVPLQRIAEWGYVDAGGCSGYLRKEGQHLWIGRNNDLWVPDLWGYAIRRQVNGRLGFISFGMRGEIFAATGLNQAGLWLHYNHLPAFVPPEGPAWTPYVLLTEMLETCKNPEEVETVLRTTKRTSGMLVFAAEGRQGTWAVLECSPQEVARLDCPGDFIAGTNHYQALQTPDPPESYAPESVARLRKLEGLLDALPASSNPETLIRVLAHPGVEQCDDGYGTVYANLCSPTQQKLWFTLGGFPAASQGNWQPIPWPF
jgi:hypothetical protein